MSNQDDGLNANLTNKQKMSTTALITTAYNLFPITHMEIFQLDKSEFREIADCLAVLYYRHVVKPTSDREGRA